MELSWVNIARGAKVVALVGFLMPWLVVSCQGQEIASATGLDLAFGNLNVSGQASAAAHDASPSSWAILALLAIIGGLVVSFVLKPLRTAALAMTGCAAAAFILCAAGMNLDIASARSEMRAPDAGANPMAAQMQGAMAEVIRFETRYGYWLTLIALLGASGAGFMAWQGRAAPRLQTPVAAPPS